MSPARKVAAVVAVLALAICLVAPVRVFLGQPTDDYARNFAIYKTWFNWATLLWFVSAPVWMVPEIFRRRHE